MSMATLGSRESMISYQTYGSRESINLEIDYSDKGLMKNFK